MPGVGGTPTTDILEEGEENLGNIKVTKMDANVLMHLRSFDFM